MKPRHNPQDNPAARQTALDPYGRAVTRKQWWLKVRDGTRDLLRSQEFEGRVTRPTIQLVAKNIRLAGLVANRSVIGARTCIRRSPVTRFDEGVPGLTVCHLAAPA